MAANGQQGPALDRRVCGTQCESASPFWDPWFGRWNGQIVAQVSQSVPWLSGFTDANGQMNSHSTYIEARKGTVNHCCTHKLPKRGRLSPYVDPR